LVIISIKIIKSTCKKKGAEQNPLPCSRGVHIFSDVSGIGGLPPHRVAGPAVLSFGPFASSSGSLGCQHSRHLALSRCWAQGIVVGLFAWLLPYRWAHSSFGPSGHRWAVHVAIEPPGSSSGPFVLLLACSIIVRPVASSSGHYVGWLACGVVLQLLVLSCSPRCCGLACCVAVSPALPSLRVVLPLFVLSRGPPCRRSAVAVVLNVGWGSVEEGRNEGRARTSHDFCHGPFSWRTVWASHFLGPPFGYSFPLAFSST